MQKNADAFVDVGLYPSLPPPLYLNLYLTK